MAKVTRHIARCEAPFIRANHACAHLVRLDRPQGPAARHASGRPAHSYAVSRRARTSGSAAVVVVLRAQRGACAAVAAGSVLLRRFGGGHGAFPLWLFFTSSSLLLLIHPPAFTR